MKIIDMLRFKPTQLLIHLPIKVDIMTIQRRH